MKVSPGRRPRTSTPPDPCRPTRTAGSMLSFGLEPFPDKPGDRPGRSILPFAIARLPMNDRRRGLNKMSMDRRPRSIFAQHSLASGKPLLELERPLNGNRELAGDLSVGSAIPETTAKI